MPNWVYASVRMEVNNSDLKLLEAMQENGGVCRTYKPMPQALKGTRSPVHIISKKEYAEEQKFNQDYLAGLPEGKEPEDWKIKKGITQEMYDELIDKYGFADWYGWASKHWDTKWGDVDFEYNIDETTDNDSAIVHILWSSAWGAIDNEIVEQLLSQFAVEGDDIPYYWWEEEQGFGASYEFIDGELTLEREWDIPQWSVDDWENEDGECFSYLEEDHYNHTDYFPKGFYLSYSLYEPYNEKRDGKLHKVE